MTEGKRKRHSEGVSEGQVLEWMTRKAAESLFLEILTWTMPEQLDLTCRQRCFQEGF